MNEIKLSDECKALFLAYAKDAGNWSNQPLVGGNVGGHKSDRGYLTNLKRKGLLKTFESDGHQWVAFTKLGVEYARLNGVEMDEDNLAAE
jgi:hypothetical protein